MWPPSAHRLAGGEAVSRLTALVPAVVCAKALGRAWPEDPDGQVRCIDEGSRALGLAFCCAPEPHESQDPGAVAAGLVHTPGALPVLGAVTGPLSASLAADVSGSDEVQDRLDDASDDAVDMIRALGARGVRRVAVVEHAISPRGGDDAVAESHRPLLNAAAHLRIDLVLVASCLEDAASLGYNSWTSSRGCSPGLGFLPAEGLDSAAALERWLDRIRAAGDLGEVITAPLDAGVPPSLVRQASHALAQVAVGP